MDAVLMGPLDEEADIRCHKDTSLASDRTKALLTVFIKDYDHSKGPLLKEGADLYLFAARLSLHYKKYIRPYGFASPSFGGFAPVFLLCFHC